MRCVDLCTDIIREETKSSIIKSDKELPSPSEIFNILNEYVIGQAYLKVLSVVATQPLQKIKYGVSVKRCLRFIKSNIYL
ncbi:MAG: hypothetical protein CM15mP111_4880 [Hyphomicrobiales bacterium]|nr:MAG: hypothetical protein CM15mP111_4880 [Hyphomicrobiales bacterium]